MKELRNKKFIQALLRQIEARTQSLSTPLNIMEVCGTHTMTIYRYGLKTILEKAGINMLSGPGCPVCITPNEIHQAAIDLVTKRKNLILTTFGDMTRVPTEKGSLQSVVPAVGSMVKIVYSPSESLETARKNPNKEIVFFGVGFETTIPSIALVAKTAFLEGLENFAILNALWLIPPPLRALVESKDTSIGGFLYPGHVSVIIGTAPYRFIAEEFGLPGAIAGFEPAAILLAIISILDQIKTGQPGVANEYKRAVRPEGNLQAQKVMKDMLEVKNAYWRGLGLIPKSGLKFKKQYAAVDAEIKYRLEILPGSRDLPGCRCGDVLRGKLSPHQCPLFAIQCKPESPYGPCMVSYEGACLAYYKYGG